MDAVVSVADAVAVAVPANVAVAVAGADVAVVALMLLAYLFVVKAPFSAQLSSARCGSVRLKQAVACPDRRPTV